MLELSGIWCHILDFPACLGFWARSTGFSNARKAAKEVCTMTALPYRTTTQLQSLTTVAQREQAANQGPTKLHLETYICVNKNNSQKAICRNWLP